MNRFSAHMNTDYRNTVQTSSTSLDTIPSVWTVKAQILALIPFRNEGTGMQLVHEYTSKRELD